MSNIISPETLAQWMKTNDVVIIDVRADLFDEQFGEREYHKGHIRGAVFLDLEKDLSGEVKVHGGNHPLPNIDTFAKKLGEIGVNVNRRVIVYDQNVQMFAPRAWFLLQHVGHENVFVLNGGFDAWKAAGYEVTTEIPNVKPTIFTPKQNVEELITMEQVKHRPADVTLIDSRANERYLGFVEPLYAKAGHIPGAINYFWEDVATTDGRWKSLEQLEEHFKSLNKEDEIIVSCGSGVSACANILALRQLGFKRIKLYPGGYSDWISYEENDIITVTK